MIKEILFGNKNMKKLDYPMLLVIFILICFGLITLASASSYAALSTFEDSNYFLFRQLAFAVVGVLAMIFISRIDYNAYKKLAYLGYVVTLLLMIAVLIPGIGVEVKGATRWLGVGSFRFQPSEIMKIMLVIAISTYIAQNHKKIVNIFGYVIPGIMLLIVCAVMYLQNHLSGTVIMGVAAISVIFASGIKLNWKILVLVTLILLAAGAIFIFSEEFRINRVLAFLNPEQDIRGDNWQAAQSLYAIGTGGIFGLGLGQSKQKFLWLPEAQNDFIFSVLCEELGLVGAVGALLVFTFFICRGYYIAMTSKDLYGTLIATGIISVFAVQILINIAVVTCTIPVTGMPLPFFSYGGTALFINLCAMGVLLNISRTCK
jgi:cell division protein FtsW